jgi:hypothetical protein
VLRLEQELSREQALSGSRRRIGSGSGVAPSRGDAGASSSSCAANSRRIGQVGAHVIVVLRTVRFRSRSLPLFGGRMDDGFNRTSSAVCMRRA